jgi:polysaccharide deacetylase 2 family uncharacterized protein YibQ
MRLLLISCFLYISFSAKALQIALIIDDMGNNEKDAMAFTLPSNATFAILHNKHLSKFFLSGLQHKSRSDFTYADGIIGW